MISAAGWRSGDGDADEVKHGADGSAASPPGLMQQTLVQASCLPAVDTARLWLLKAPVGVARKIAC